MIHLSDTQNLFVMAAGMAATGAVGGVLAGLLGVGGGIVIVPVLYTVLGLLGVDPSVQMHVAVATSLATIIPTSISSARSHHRKQAVDWDLVRRWAAAVVLGAICGGIVAGHLRSASLSLIFAAVAILVAAFLSLRREGTYLLEKVPPGPAAHIMPFGIGIFSAMMGIGGGTLSVPLLSACNYPVRLAVGTASVFGLFIAVPAAVAFVLSGWQETSLPPLSLGYVNLFGLLLIAPLTTLCAPFGARIAHSIAPTLLRRFFAIFLLATAAKMIHGALN